MPLIHKSFRLSAEDIELLKRLARKKGRPMTWELRYAIRLSAVEAGLIEQVGDISTPIERQTKEIDNA